MVTVVDRLSLVGSFGTLGDDSGNLAYVAQTFRAAGSALNSVEFLVDGIPKPDASEFRLLITTVTLVGGQFDPGTVLFESALLVDPSDVGASYTLFKVDTSKLALTPGANYAIILDAARDADAVPGAAIFGSSYDSPAGVDYTDGFLASRGTTTGDRATDFEPGAWVELSDFDLSFRLVFSNPGVTIAGTKGRDKVDATNTPKKEPLPTAGDDSISGLGDRDKLSGLGGDDTIDGGKDKDKLFGGDGEDLFLFNAGLKWEPDRIMDFVPVDDTILMAMRVFKGLAQGALSEAAFRDIGEVATDDDRVIYKASGKLLFDRDGKGGDDPLAFAKLIGAPDIGAGDFLVV